jgi:DNA repair protein RecO (recombination protein O)
MDDPWALSILSAACAVADGAVPEREPQPRIFRGLLHLIASASTGMALLPDLIRWELGLLQDLGFGLDLTTCAVTGTADSLAYVSPRTGRAVSQHAAGLWKERLLPLPAFLTTEAIGNPAQWAEGLRLTERFLARDAFGLRHQAIPAARLRLSEKLNARAAASTSPPPEPAPAAQTDRSAPD